MSQPPKPKDSYDLQRWEHTRLRRRMLTGRWGKDLLERLKRSLGATRSDAIRDVDLSSNVFANTCQTISTLYDADPSIKNIDADSSSRMDALLANAGFTSIMQDVQRMTIGLREMLLHIHVIPTPGETQPVEVVLRPVYPDLVLAEPMTNRPYQPRKIKEAREICVNGQPKWVWMESELVEVDGVQIGFQTVEDTDGLEITEEVQGGIFSGDQYPYKSASGNAVLPYVLYHAQMGATLFDPYALSELVEGTLEQGVDRTSYHHSLRQAAWQQRYIINGGMTSDEVNGRQEIVLDPSTIATINQTDPQFPVSVGAWTSPVDPAAMQEAIGQDERRLASNAGVPSAELIRSNSDPRSGYSMALSMDGKKQAAKRFEPVFRRSDLQLLKSIAIMVNSVLGSEYLAEDGWSISYRQGSMTEDEFALRQDRIIAQLDAGLISKAEARSKLMGEPLDVATANIKMIKTDTNTI